MIKSHKEDLRKNYGVKVIGLFGFYVRGEQCEDSDVDILVELEKPIGFVRFIKLENIFSDLLGIKVDLVTKKALKPYIGKQILEEVHYVWRKTAQRLFLREKYSEIPWQEIVGMRNKLIHEYFGIDLDIVWQSIEEDLIPLEKIIKKIFYDLYGS